MDAERYKDNLREAKYVITKLEFKMEKLADRLEILKDDLNQVFRIRTNYIETKNGNCNNVYLYWRIVITITIVYLEWSSDVNVLK